MMDIKIIKDTPISKKELKKMAEDSFGDLVKAVIDVQQDIMAVGGEFHSEEEDLLTREEGSKREYTWGINLYPHKSGEDWIEFDSVINIKSVFGNRTRGVDNQKARDRIKEIIKRLVQE